MIMQPCNGGRIIVFFFLSCKDRWPNSCTESMEFINCCTNLLNQYRCINFHLLGVGEFVIGEKYREMSRREEEIQHGTSEPTLTLVYWLLFLSNNIRTAQRSPLREEFKLHNQPAENIWTLCCHNGKIIVFRELHRASLETLHDGYSQHNPARRPRRQ